MGWARSPRLSLDGNPYYIDAEASDWVTNSEQCLKLKSSGMALDWEAFLLEDAIEIVHNLRKVIIISCSESRCHILHTYRL